MSTDQPIENEAEAEQAPDQLTLAQKLDRLFATKHPDGRRHPYTLREVSDLITVQEQLKQGPGATVRPVKISFSYLSQLRTGSKDNPSFRQLAALADFFGVPTTYFTGPAPEVDRVDTELAGTAMRDRGVRDIALKVAEFTPTGRQVVAGIIRGLETVPGMTLRTETAADDVGD
jgi:transcriptional regulator with XRE-family HTH domain